MATKMTVKNQITIPKRVLTAAGLTHLKKEERIPEEQWQKFETYVARTDKCDRSLILMERQLSF
jgi:hypothetical protein